MGKRCCNVNKWSVIAAFLAMGSVAVIVGLWTVALTGSFVVKPPWQRHRLPTALVPHHYNVTLWPRLTPHPTRGVSYFTGHSMVEFECVEPTNVIVIHSHRLVYNTVTLTAKGEKSAPGIRSDSLESATQYLVIELKGKLTRGQRYQLYTEFTGELADDLAGLYLSEYEEDGVKRVVITSQMHPTNARKTFPCFDEPALKAIFHITLIHSPGTIALSNGMEEEVVNTTIDGVAVTQTRFEPTEKMSTYLLAIIVSDYAHLSSKQGDILIRIWARRKAIEGGQGDYALNVTGPILDFFQQYYNTSYPLSKSDQIALPDFYYGAMENWGLVTYRETMLLYDPVTSSNRNRESTATIIAHELAHMWFGNLVTLKWWNEVWLNEGFASYVSYLGADHAEPQWNVKDLIVLDDVQKVFAVDALASSHPLSSREADIVLPHQISAQFDAISYSKGAAVLRMLSDFLSEQVFVQGLSSYLNHFAFGNTAGSDLWDHLQMAVDASGTFLPAGVNDIMQGWVSQMGFPVVTIHTSTGALSQRHFLLDPKPGVPSTNFTWLIPIRWMKSGKVQGDTYWLMEESGVNSEMRTGGDWVLANINVTGYYRVNYDLGNWERLLTQLNTDHQVIPVINRAQLVDDAFNLARASVLHTTLALRTTLYLDGETQYMPWQSALNNMHYYYRMLDRTEVYGPLQGYMKKLVTPLFLYFKNVTSEWTQVPGGHTDQYNQVNAIDMACKTGVAECQNLTTTWFRQWMDTRHNLIHPNLRSSVYCSAMAAGGEAEWQFGWDQFKSATVASEASKLMHALACTNDTELLKRYLSFTLKPDMIRKQDATSVIVSIAGNREGQDLAWNFVRENWQHMFYDYGADSFNFANLISGVTERFSTEAELQQLKAFEEENGDFGSATLALKQACERTTANINWLQENKQDILNWFNQQNTVRERG